MRRPKKNAPRPTNTKGYWTQLTDDELLKRELLAEQPHLVEDLVFELPKNDAEPFVEFCYDLKGSSHEKLRCVHCHQPHLKGLIVNQGGCRFYVGHICGERIYGEKFNRLKVDFDAAVERRAVASRVRRVREVLEPFNAWMHGVVNSGVFDAYSKLHSRWYVEFEWLFDNLAGVERVSGRINSSAGHCVLPTRTFFYPNTDPERAFKDAANELGVACLTVISKVTINKDIESTFGRIRSFLTRLENAIDQLREVERFFQPEVLAIVAAWATQHDNPKKRKWIAGLNNLTRVSEGGHRDVLQIPNSYKAPSKEPIATFRAALADLPTKMTTE